jgi:hypothetical protein
MHNVYSMHGYACMNMRIYSGRMPPMSVLVSLCTNVRLLQAFTGGNYGGGSDLLKKVFTPLMPLIGHQGQHKDA